MHRPLHYTVSLLQVVQSSLKQTLVQMSDYGNGVCRSLGTMTFVFVFEVHNNFLPYQLLLEQKKTTHVAITLCCYQYIQNHFGKKVNLTGTVLVGGLNSKYIHKIQSCFSIFVPTAVYYASCHYEKKFTKNIQCPKILNKFTKFQFEEYLKKCQKIDFCEFLLKISKNLLNSLNIQ